MNREILFKAKRIDTGEWVEGYIIRNTHKTFIGYLCGGADIDIVEIDPSTLCQCTGLTDKNGKKIYENDIVKAIYKPKDGDLTVDNFIIKWDKCNCKYVGYYAQRENVYNPLLFGSQCSFEVIGSIFDNPELLEGGAE